MNDIRKRFPYYKSDFTDAFNFQCFSTIFFMYFASIGLVITFAGLMGEKFDWTSLEPINRRLFKLQVLNIQ